MHGLTPLAAACPAVHVFERPTLFLDALWLPYRRERGEIEAAIRSSGPLKAVFGHADVVRPYAELVPPWNVPSMLIRFRI